MLTPLERFQEATMLRTPDQVPVMPFATGHFMSWFAGIPESRAVEYWKDYRTQFSAQMVVVKAFRQVKIWPGIYPDFGPAVETSALGCVIRYPDNASPTVYSPAVKRPEDIERLQVPDPKKDGLMPKALEAYEFMVEKTPQDLKKNYGYLDGLALAMGPTDIAGLSMGFDKLHVGMYKYPDLVLKAMEITSETVIEWIKAQADITGGYNFVQIYDDGVGFLNPSQFRKFSLPYLKKICSTFRRRDNAVLFHSDANTTHILEDLSTIGANLINYGPDMNTGIVKQKVGKIMCLMGGLAPLGELKTGTPSDVEKACLKALKQAAAGGGFILSQCGGIAAGTPAQNIRATISSGQKFGKYPFRF